MLKAIGRSSAGVMLVVLASASAAENLPHVFGPPVSWMQVASYGTAETLGLQGDANSFAPNISMRSLSYDGRYVGFVSQANNLVAGDNNGYPDVFVRDTWSGITTLESVSSGGSIGNGGSAGPALTPDARYLVFHSDANNLVSGDSNGVQDIFVRERDTGTITRVSVDSSGVQANGLSDDPSISADGRYVAYLSLATNLVPGDTNGVADVFVHDLQTGATARASISSLGVQGNGASATPQISADGRYVAFYSWSSNLVANDLNGQPDVFVRDLQTGTTTLVSVDSNGVQGNAGSFSPAISADGRWIAFESNADNLVAGDSNGASDVFLRDTLSGTTTRISVAGDGTQANGASARAAITDDGRFITFDSTATNLVAGDSNGFADVFVHDRVTGSTVRISVDSNGAQGNGVSQYASISGDGSTIAFQSDASNLVPTDSNAHTDVFVFDRASAVTTRASLANGIAANNDSYSHATSCCLRQISADGRIVAFESRASNLVGGDTNSRTDVFAVDLAAASTTRVSVSSAGVQGNDRSGDASISSTGRFIAFDSDATNLVTADTNGATDVFLYDRQYLVTERISLDSAGNQANGASSNPSVSADGRFVAFESTASNLVAGDSNGNTDVFVRDRQDGSTQRASVSSTSTQGNGPSFAAAISDDGRYVAFASLANNLVPGDSNGATDIFVRDLLSGTTERVSVDSSGVQGNGTSRDEAISADGRYVAFDSAASNLVAGDTNGAIDTFVRDRLTGTTTRVSVNSAGIQGNGSSVSVAISADGRFVAFQSQASNLFGGDTNGYDDIFVRDRLFGTTTLVSMDSNGTEGVYLSELPSISADGTRITFDSPSYNWTVDSGVDHPGGVSTGNDVFVVDVPAAPDLIFRDGFE